MKKSLVLMMIVLTLGLLCNLWSQTTIFSETFDGTWTIPSTLSPAWSGTSTPVNNEWHRQDYTTGWTSTSGLYSPAYFSASYSARFHTYNASSGTTGDFISPTLDFSGSSNSKLLEFYYINTSGTDVVRVYLSTDDGATWGSALYTTGVSAAWAKQTVILGTSNSATVKIKLTATSDYGSTDIGVDDFKVIDYGSVIAPLTGTKTINPVGGDYTSFTDAINDLNLAGVGTGGVTFNVAAGTTYTEYCPAITATGTSSNSITFQKSGIGANPIIYAGVGVSTSADYILKLNGVDYLTWDGIDLMENAANTTTTTQAEYGLWVAQASTTNGSQYNIFKNFKIVLNNTNTATRGIYHYYGSTPTSNDGTNSNNDYYNIVIENTNYGIYMYGTSSTTYLETGNYIRNCTIGSETAGNISGAYGIYANYEHNLTVRYNTVRNMSYSSTIYGMYLYTLKGNANVYGNKVYNIAYSGTSTSTNYGIYVYLYTTGTNTIKLYNNMVWGLTHGYTGTATTSYLVYGIYMSSAGAGNTYNVDFNTVRIDGPATGSNAALYFTSGSGINTARNNILANFSGGNATPYHLGLYSALATSLGASGSVSNNNVIYIDNSLGGYPVRGSSTNYATIAAWTTASGQDANSRPGNPQFVSSSDVHIQTGVPTPVESKGAYGTITWVSLDIDGNTRHVSTPDIGADEGDFTLEVICETPTAQPTNLALEPYSTAIAGSFDAASPAADKYLVVRSAAAHDTAPVDGTYYTPGNTLGNGTIVQASSALTFNATGLSNSTLYYITVYSFNDTGIGAPKYLTTSPLSDTLTTLPAAPAVPVAFTAAALNSSQIALTATANASTDPILVAWNSSSTFGTPSSVADYAIGDPISGGGTVLYFGPASGLTNHTGLTPATAYYYRAWSYVTSGSYEVYSSSYLSANATTWATPVSSYPFSEGFESGFTDQATIGAPYAQVSVSGSYNWTANSTLTTYNRAPHSGAWNAYLHYSDEQWLMRPFTFQGGVEYTFKMFARQDMSTASYANIKVAYGNDFTHAAMTNVIIPETGIINGDYQLLTGTFTPAATGDYVLGIKGFMNATPYYISIDDIYLRPSPTVPETPEYLSPAMAAVDQSPLTNLSWTNVGPLTKVDVYFSTDSTLVYNLDSSVRVATDQTDPLDSYDLPVLEYSTRYFWQVVCKDDLANTAASGLYYFNTMADPSTPLPWTEGFATTTWPANWVTNYSLSSTSYYGNPAPGAYKYTGTEAGEGYLTLPPLGPIAAYTMLSFDYKLTTSPSTPTAFTMTAEDSIEVLVSLDKGDTFSEYYQIDATNHTVSTNWARKQIPLWGLGAEAGDKIIIKLLNYYAASSYYFQVDNFEVSAVPDSEVYVLTPTAWDFGAVDLTRAVDKQFEIRNDGAVELTITDISLSGDTDFSLVDIPSPLPTLGFGETAYFKVRFIPTTAGAHTATLSITDSVSRTVHTYTDALTGVGVAPLSLPYTQNFDTDWSEMVFTSVDANNWVVGPLAKPSYLTAPHSAPNAMATVNLTGDLLLDNLSMWAYTPAFTITGTSGVGLSFWQAFESEAGYDNMVVEYSTDLGETWTRVDSVQGVSPNFSTPNSQYWYNINNTYAGTIQGPKWGGVSATVYTGHTNNWVNSASLIPLDSLGTASTIKFRFYFDMDSSGNAYEGFAIDDINIVQQPVVEYALSNMTMDPVVYAFEGDTLTFSATVTNYGYDTTGSWVRFLLNGAVIDSVFVGPIPFMGTAPVSYQYAVPIAREYGTRYDFGFQLPDDEVLSNNDVELADVVIYESGWLAQDFEGAFLPSKWIKWGVPYWTKSSSLPYEGAYAAQVTLAVSDSTDGSNLATPRLVAAVGDSVIFWAKSSVAGMKLQLKTYELADTTATWSALGAPIDLTTDYTRYAMDLSSLAGTYPRVAFTALSGGYAGTVYLDAVSGPQIYIPTSPPGPVVMVAPAPNSIDINPKTVVLDWDTPISGGDPEGYFVYIGTDDTAEELIDTYTHVWEVIVPTTQYQPYTTGSYNMDYSTDYFWMVIPYNSNGIIENLGDVEVRKLTTQPPAISGNWTIDPAFSTGGTNFNNWVDAVNYLNAYGVEIGGATITVAEASYTDSIPAIKYNGTETTQITFIGASGTRAKPVLMASAGNGTLDAILQLVGADYVTIDGFDIKENPANTDATTQMEFGVYVTNNGATDGAKNNTVKNCNITLAGTSPTRGVYQTALSVTTAAGSNSYNKYYDNDLLNCWYGYYLNGSSTTGAYDAGNEVGAVTDGSITNAVQGVNFNYQTGMQIYNQDIVLQGGAVTAYEYGIYSTAGPGNTSVIHDNDITLAASQTSTSNDTDGIYISANTQTSIYNNTIHNITLTGSSAYFYGIYVSQGVAKTTNYIYNNEIRDITSISTFYGIYLTASAPSEVYGNDIYNLTRSGSGTTYGYYIGANSTLVTSNIYDNTLHDITSTSSGTMYLLYAYYGLLMNVYNNQIYNITHGAGSIYGLYSYYSTTAGVKNVYNNQIHGITGGSSIYALYSYYGTTQNIYKNKVYDITYSGTSTSGVYGLYFAGTTSTTANVYNNFVYDLKAPNGTSTTASVAGIYASSSNLINLWNNTVYLNATGPAAFNTAAMYHAGATMVDLKNNIFVNKSTTTSGKAMAFRKSTTSLTNISTTTDKNIWYAGTPSATRPIYYDGTNTKATIAEYKTWMASRPADQNSQTEDVPFVGSSARVIDVHINPTIPTFVEGNGIPIATVTVDIDGDTRNATTPDIGADEGNFTMITDPPTPSAQPTNLALVPASTSISGTFTLSDASHYLVVRHVVPLTATPVELKRYAAGDTLGSTGIVVGNYTEGAFNSTGLVTDSLYYYTIFANNMNALYGPHYLLTAPLSGSMRTLPPAPANPTSLTAVPYSYQQVNLGATANANSDPILVAWAPNATFGIPASNADYSVGDPITGGGTVLYIGPAAGLTSHTGLTELTTYYYKAWSYVVSGSYEVYSAGLASTPTFVTTPMAPINPPYTQDFQGTFPPAGWTRYSGILSTPTSLTSGTRWIQDEWLNVSSNPDKAARVNIYSNYQDWLISPQFNIPAEGDYILKFNYGLTDYAAYAAPDNQTGTDDRFIVLVGDGTSWTPANTLREWNNTGSPYVYNDIPWTGASVTIPLTGISGIKYIAFYGESTVTNVDNDFFVDDVQVKLLAPYPEAVTNPNPATAAVNQSPIVNLGWVYDGTVTKVDVYFSTDSTLVSTMDSSVKVASNQTSPLDAFDLPALTYNTTYYWKVVAKNDLEQTAVSPMWNFTTMTDPSLPLPYTQNFGSSTTWPADIVKTGLWYVSSTHGNPSYGAYTNLDSSGERNTLVLPQLGPVGAVTIMEVDYRFVDYTSYPATATVLSEGDSLNVYVSKDYGQTYTRLTTVNSTNHTATTAWNRMQLDLAGAGVTSGDRILLKFEGTYGAGDWYLDLDNFSVEALPENPVFVVTPDSLHYGNVEIYDTDTQEFVISNEGAVSFNVTSIYVEGGDAADFTVTATGLPAAVAYNTPYSFDVSVSPLTIGTKTTTLKIVDSIARVTHEIPLVAEAIDEVIGTPVNLAATVSDYNDVTLTWSTNNGLSTPPYIHWDNGTYSSAYGFANNPAYTVDVASKFSSTDIARYAGYDLTKIRFYATNYSGSTYRVRVWTGDDASVAPTTMVVDQLMASYTQNAWNEVVLDTPVSITGAEAIWIGFNVTTTIQAYPMPADAGPGVIGKGALYSLNSGAWTASTSGKNWNIQGYIEESIARGDVNTHLLSVPVINVNNATAITEPVTDPAFKTPAATRLLTGFNVYRDDVQINTTLVTEMTYQDLDVPNGIYEYYVEAVYVGGTSVSNTIEVEINRPLPRTLPFTEGWTSGSFDTNVWTAGATNWAINTGIGLPTPAARFYYSPILTSYSQSLTSWEIDASTYPELNVKYDVMLDNESLFTTEKLAVEVFDGTSWVQIDEFTNQAGDFAWTTKTINVSSLVGGTIFQLRFRAYGFDSSSILYWGVDNIMVEPIITPDPPVVTITYDGLGNAVLDWAPVTGATSYKVYASQDAYADFPSGWTVVGTPAANTYSIPAGGLDYRFFRVTTVVGSRQPVLGPQDRKPVINKSK
jgi:hypothetical protein